MYSVVLSSVICFGTTAADCCWHKKVHAGYAGYAMPMPVVEMPLGCGCMPCPSCGGMPPIGPPMMGDMGMPLPPAGGAILPPAGLTETIQPPPPALGETRTSANQAMFVVRLPADAQLLAEHVPIPGTGPVRVFVSPPLEPGRKYVYELTIEVNRNGSVLTDKQVVEFEAGKTAN